MEEEERTQEEIIADAVRKALEESGVAPASRGASKLAGCLFLILVFVIGVLLILWGKGLIF